MKCYQNQTPINGTVNGTATNCLNIGVVKATGCLKYTSFITKTVTRMCDYTNCNESGKDRNGCWNSTNDTETCCCKTDGCNFSMTARIAQFFLNFITKMKGKDNSTTTAESMSPKKVVNGSHLMMKHN
uniref:Uncharacterized protein n=1 Tax=Panagrolaimus sp. ES5 TaxID=591445 RepID=A0AC34FJQ9_9BILA